LAVLSHEIGCDDCFEYVATYAEYRLAGSPPPDPMAVVGEHLERCRFCQEEFERLLSALQP